MKKEVKGKFPLMESVVFVEKAMISRGWNKSQLTKESGASSAAVTRFFQDGMINSKNTFKILHTLNLIKNDYLEQTNFMPGWPEDTVEYCQKLKKVLENKEDNEIVKKMIDAYIEKYEAQTPKKDSEKKVMSST